MKATTQKPTEILFPTAGLNVATEFGRQPKMTTPEGENVRAYEVLERRERGGSRPGLIKYIAQQVPGGASVIQHLTVVVDPQAPFLLADDQTDHSPFPYPETLDPSTNNNAAGYGDRNPGRFVRGGGSGRPQYRHPMPPSDEITVVSTDGVGDGVVFLTAEIGGEDTGVTVRAYFEGGGPPDNTNWLVDSETFSALNAAAIGTLTNSPPVVANLAVTPGDVNGGYVATFSVDPSMWTY